MIAPLRQVAEPAAAPRSKRSLRRARRWIMRTLVEPTTETSSPPSNNDRLRMWLIVGWVVLTAAAYFARLGLDLIST